MPQWMPQVNKFFQQKQETMLTVFNYRMANLLCFILYPPQEGIMTFFDGYGDDTRAFVAVQGQDFITQSIDVLLRCFIDHGHFLRRLHCTVPPIQAVMWLEHVGAGGKALLNDGFRDTRRLLAVWIGDVNHVRFHARMLSDLSYKNKPGDEAGFLKCTYFVLPSQAAGTEGACSIFRIVYPPQILWVFG